jgi:hypothetical protein
VTLSRSEFVRRLVLNSICDDLENVDQVILRDVAADGAKCGLTIERPEVVEALALLTEGGLATAHRLPAPNGDPFSGELLPCMPPMGVIEEDFKSYFYRTEKGLELHLSDDTWWPFDDEGNLRQDWHLASDSPLY